jgi:hypothetical protein
MLPARTANITRAACPASRTSLSPAAASLAQAGSTVSRSFSTTGLGVCSSTSLTSLAVSRLTARGRQAVKRRILAWGRDAWQNTAQQLPLSGLDIAQNSMHPGLNTTPR